MLKIRHLKAVRIEERLDCFSKTHFVFAYIGQFLCRVPLKLHELLYHNDTTVTTHICITHKF